MKKTCLRTKTFQYTNISATMRSRERRCFVAENVVSLRRLYSAETSFARQNVHCTVGWSDLALLSIFENLHISADQVYF